MKDRLITILGPTATGKTEAAVRLAERLGSAVISGDAYQVYRGMNTGTAKVTKEEARGVPHYLVDILDPGESYSAADFQQRAGAIIHAENEAGRIPIVAGGTGLYVQGLLEGYSFLPKGKDRARWEALYAEKGKDALAEELRKRGAEVPPDPQRMLRKLELLDAGAGEEKPEKEISLVYDGPVIGITMDRTVLYDRINKRVHHMMQAGLVEELEGLLKAGVPRDAQALKGIGYKELLPVLDGTLSREEGEALIQKHTRHFAKRQLTWYRRMPYIHWVVRNPSDDMWYREIEAYVISFFRGDIRWKVK